MYTNGTIKGEKEGKDMLLMVMPTNTKIVSSEYDIVKAWSITFLAHNMTLLQLEI